MRITLFLVLLLLNSFSPAQSKAPLNSFAKNTCDAVSQRAQKRSKVIHKITQVLTPHNCCKYIGDYVTVKFVVDNTHPCRKGHVYLNESRDYKTCFAAIISAQGRKRFAVDMDKAYKGRTVTVTGVLEMYDGAPKIVLDKPEQLLVIE